MKPAYHSGAALAVVTLVSSIVAWHPTASRASDRSGPPPLPPADTAVAAVIEANEGKVPATGEQLWHALCKLGKFAQLPVPYSAVQLDSGLANPRVVIAPMVSGVNPADLTSPNVEGRLFLAVNMEQSVRGGEPRVKSVEFISWNSARRQFDFGFIENMGGSGEPFIQIVDGGRCFSCHKNRGPILGGRPWSNTAHDDVLRFATASGLLMTGAKLPEFGPFALPRLGAGGTPLPDRVDGMALASSEAPEVDFSVRFGAELRAYRDTFRLLTHTAEGRKALVFMLVAISEAGTLDANDREMRRALNATVDRSFSRFVGEWTNLRRSTKSSVLIDVNPALIMASTGIRRDSAGWLKPVAGTPPVSAPIKVPGLTGGNGSTWVAPMSCSPPVSVPQSVGPVTRELLQRAGTTKLAIDNYTSTLIELAQYEINRSAGRHGLISRVQPSNPRAFFTPPIQTPIRLSDVVTPVLLAGTIGLTDGDRRFLARALADGAKQAGESKVTPAALAKEVFEGPQFASVFAGGPLPDRDEFKDRFVAGLDDVLKTRHGVSYGFAPDRREYASGPRYNAAAAEEKEAAVVPTSACLRCHEISGTGKASRFDLIPPLAFDPFDKPGREAWLRSADPKRKQEVLTKLVGRLVTDADMPPEDAPEHNLFRVKAAAAFGEVKRVLTTELSRVK